MGMFTATRLQVATYLLGVCPFSIAFLVFLNSSVSFVVTDLIGRQDGVGDIVGNLGFVDELVALIACPMWGLLSDKLGIKLVCVLGYTIIGVALFIFVQAKNVYPQLLLARLLFSVGGAAASTMVTAILPTMSFVQDDDEAEATTRSSVSNQVRRHVPNASITSEITITPQRFQARNESPANQQALISSVVQNNDTSKIAGFVGMATGCGALVALSVFLPLPARFQKAGVEPGPAIQYSYYVVGVIALVTASVCSIGFRGLRSEEHKGMKYLLNGQTDARITETVTQKLISSLALLYQALIAGFKRKDILVGYVGGFVARASSVGISLFIPLLVNAAFSSSGLCNPTRLFDNPAGLPDIKRRCPRAYVVAAELTGVSQFVALVCAPGFGYWSARTNRKLVPLLFAAVLGIIGYPLFALQFDPHDENTRGRIIAFLAVCLIGISQIGSIVCSLGILSAGVLKPIDAKQSDSDEAQHLLDHSVNPDRNEKKSLTELKGSVAGVYSFYGGAAILILTKVGGALFDSTSKAAPFYLMASFNAIMLIVCIAVGLST